MGETTMNDEPNMRLAVEVLPVDVVLEALTKLAGGDLYAKRCAHCGEWYCFRESEAGKVRRVEKKTRFCSERCTSRAKMAAFRARQKAAK